MLLAVCSGILEITILPEISKISTKSFFPVDWKEIRFVVGFGKTEKSGLTFSYSVMPTGSNGQPGNASYPKAMRLSETIMFCWKIFCVMVNGIGFNVDEVGLFVVSVRGNMHPDCVNVWKRMIVGM